MEVIAATIGIITLSGIMMMHYNNAFNRQVDVTQCELHGQIVELNNDDFNLKYNQCKTYTFNNVRIIKPNDDNNNNNFNKLSKYLHEIKRK